MVKKIVYALLIILVLIQFIRPTKNINVATGTSPNDITKIYVVPEDVAVILKRSCYDCHSNNTAYPWYNNIQPVAWWLNHHVTEGKRELNFDEYASYRIRRQYKKMEDIIDQLKDDEMPISSYLWIHKDAKLNSAQKLLISNWADTIRKQIEAKYPADSLKRK